VLRVTQDGQFIWHPDADRMIEEGNFNFNPAMPHILRALRKREWVGLTKEEINQGLLRSFYVLEKARAWRDGVTWAEEKLRSKNI